jgi:hypothetical protein
MFAPEGYIVFHEVLFGFDTPLIDHTALRRALSAGRLQAFYIGRRGHIHPLAPHFWNSRGGEAQFTGGQFLWLHEYGEDGPPVDFLLLEAELHAWLAGQQLAKNGPVQACAAWLSDMMKHSPHSSPPKQRLWNEAKAKFQELSWRAFGTAWSTAKANNPTATGWGHAGRKPKSAAKSVAKSAAKSAAK